MFNVTSRSWNTKPSWIWLVHGRGTVGKSQGCNWGWEKDEKVCYYRKIQEREKSGGMWTSALHCPAVYFSQLTDSRKPIQQAMRPISRFLLSLIPEAAHVHGYPASLHGGSTFRLMAKVRHIQGQQKDTWPNSLNKVRFSWSWEDGQTPPNPGNSQWL